MKHKLCVLGAFGFIYPHYDGQTIKSRNLLTLLQEKRDDVDFFEAQRLKKNRLSLIVMLWKVVTSNTVYYLPAQNNLTYLFPIIYYLARVFHTRLHYFVVGGWLVELLEDKPWHRKALSRITGIHCETQFMRNALEESYGFKNVDVFPNFRINDFKPTAHHEEGKLKLVFMARVVKMKGLDLIFKLGDYLISKELQNKISVDFYGPQQNDNNDIEYFNANLAHFPFMRYLGPLEPSDIYVTLEKYDAMLLPTHYFTEGLPGSILDAYISGIPVVVTKWKHATEFVDDGRTGIIIPFDDDGCALFNAVISLYENGSLLAQMKTQSQKKWQDFSSGRAWELLQDYH